MTHTRDVRESSIERWPAERFYWAVIDGSLARGRGRRRRVALDYLTEDLLPVPVEELHVTYVACEGTSLVACAATREQLREAIARGALGVQPADAPEFLRERLKTLARGLEELELLSAEFEPPRLRAARRRVGATLACVCCLGLLVVGVGSHRRAVAARQAIDELNRQRDAMIAAILLPDPTATLPPQLRLVAEVRRLEQAHAAAPAVLRRDAAIDLAAVVARWPRGKDLSLDAVNVADDSVTMRGTAPSSADAQPLAEALAGLPGWSLDQPQFRSNADDVTFTVVLRRTKETRP